MNRQIKFRAWDTEENKMIDVRGLTFDYDPPMVIENIGECYKEDAGAFPLMQFTGLIDKNGKEIYEGDIVRVRADSLNDEQIVEVKWRKEGFWEYFNGLEGCEIIGNIYENPELLSV